MPKNSKSKQTLPENGFIAIWGIGTVGTTIYNICKEKYNIKCFIDNFKTKESKMGIKIIYPNEIRKGSYKIVIAIADYEEVVEQCLDMGLCPIDDFITYDVLFEDIIPTTFITKSFSEIPSEWISKLKGDRKVVTIIGNCHVPVIRQFLQANPEFCKKYVLTQLLPIHIAQDEKLLEVCLAVSDIIISQPISNSNKCHSMFGTDNISKRLIQRQKLVLIPNLFFDGYFFFECTNTDLNMSIINGWSGNEIFPEQDLILDDLRKRFDISDILQIVTYENLFNENLCKWALESRFKQLDQRENNCAIKMADFIKDHYREEQLFYTIKHPTNVLIKEEVVRLLRYLGIKKPDQFIEEEKINDLGTYEEKIYPGIFKALSLGFIKDSYKLTIKENASFSKACELYMKNKQENKKK